MHPLKKSAFSSDARFFAYVNEENLFIYEIASNKLIDCNFIRNENACSCICWIPTLPKHNKNAAKECHDDIFEENLLATGDVKGDVIIYNIKTRNRFLHLAGRHHGAINDMCLYTKSNSFFTCSNDQHIAVWDISTGRQISKWKTNENPPSSICVIDDDHLLSSSTIEILWWSISKKTVLKKFSGHMTEIIKLLPVNVASMKSYFLSAAVDDTKINAWSLTSSASEPFVASFALPLPPTDMDISKVSLKDKPSVLTTVTKDGWLHIFEYALNGSMSESVKPKASIFICPDCEEFSILSVKLTVDAKECVVAYGSSKSTIAFKHVKIKELFQKNEKEDASISSELPAKVSVVNNSTKAKNSSVNGLSDSVLKSYKSKLRSSTKLSSTVTDLCNPTEEEVSNIELVVNKDVNLDDPKSTVDALLKAIEKSNDNIIETIFKNSDAEYMSSVVQTLPTSSLKIVLNEINHRLLQKHSIALCRWLKEILQIHLRYLIQCSDVVELLKQTREHLSSMNISETLHKMTSVQGLLNLQVQDSSSDESDDLETMEL